MKLFLAFSLAVLLGCNNHNDRMYDIGNVTIPVTKWQNKKQIARVDHSLYGCFGGGASKVVIYSIKNGYVASFERRGKRPVERMISLAQFNAFEHFIFALKKFKGGPGGCTTSESFLVLYKDELIERSDNECIFTEYTNWLDSVAFSYQDEPVANRRFIYEN